MDILIEHNEPALRIVTRPYLVGDELEAEAFAASRHFLSKHRFASPVEVVILEGARYYHLAEAHEEFYDEPVQKCYIDCKRYFDGEWDARISVCELAGLREANTVLIGDTIATGITLHTILGRLIEELERKESAVDQIELFTIAGASGIEPRLAPLEEQLDETGISLRLTYANAAYRLAENGTDLLFDGARYDPLAKRQLENELGDFLAEMGCAIWDWGDRFRSPQKHLQRIRDYYLDSKRETPAYIVDGIEQRLEEEK